jgi:RNA polymerase sigma factor (sigma-70 family)
MDLYSLLYEAKRNNLTAQRFIYEQFATGMFMLCRRYIKPDETAEEIMMDGFLKIFNSLPKFKYKSDRSAKAWMKKIMKNECLAHLRRKNNYLENVEVEAIDSDSDEHIISGIAVKELYQCIIQLPEGYRTVFILYEMEGMNHKEIANCLGIKIRTSQSQLTKAKRMLKSMIIKKHVEYANRIRK